MQSETQTNIIQIFENEEGMIDYTYNKEFDITAIIGIIEQVKINLIINSPLGEEDEIEQE